VTEQIGSSHGKQEAERTRERRKGWGEEISFKGIPPMTYFLYLDPIS
jgi:hypothetical protein